MWKQVLLAPFDEWQKQSSGKISDLSIIQKVWEEKLVHQVSQEKNINF